MNRRSLLQGILGASAALVLPPSLAENTEAARKYWSLDQTMLAPSGWYETGWFDTQADWRKEWRSWRIVVDVNRDMPTWRMETDALVAQGMSREEAMIYYATASVMGVPGAYSTTVSVEWMP